MNSAVSQAQEKASLTQVKAWERRRPAWTRTDTMRWLNERSAGVLAWLRRGDEGAPSHSESMGRWLQENRPAVFLKAHHRLTDAAGEAELNVLQVLK